MDYALVRSYPFIFRKINLLLIKNFVKFSLTSLNILCRNSSSWSTLKLGIKKHRVESYFTANFYRWNIEIPSIFLLSNAIQFILRLSRKNSRTKMTRMKLIYFYKDFSSSCDILFG